MQAVHIKSDDLDTDYQAALTEMLIRFTDGVKDVVLVRSMHLISVLYDEQIADATQIIRALRAAGVRARRLRPARSRATRAPRVGVLS
jgi:hypothetical protein